MATIYQKKENWQIKAYIGLRDFKLANGKPKYITQD